MPLDSRTALDLEVERRLNECERRLDNATEQWQKLYAEHKTLLDDFARVRARHRDLLAILQRMYPPDSTIGLAVKRLVDNAA